MSNVPTCLRDTVSREIGAEAILWADRPGPWAYGRRHWKTSLFGIPFTAFSVFWTLGASGRLESFRSGRPAPPFFTLWGLMFVGIGVAMLLAPLLASIKAERMYYVLTDKRAIIFEKLFTTKITSITARRSQGLSGSHTVTNKGILFFAGPSPGAEKAGERKWSDSLGSIPSKKQRPRYGSFSKTARGLNHSIQRMRASRLGHSQFESPWRLALTADADRSA